MKEELTMDEHRIFEELVEDDRHLNFDPVGNGVDLRLCEARLSTLQKEQYVMRMIRHTRDYTNISKISASGNPTCKDILNVLRMPNITKCEILLGVL